MAYLRCAGCGAKALEVASTCPTCARPFDVFTAGGARMPLTRCARCGIMHCRDRSCQWCGDVAPRWRSTTVTRAALGAGVAAFATLGLVRYGTATQQLLTPPAVSAFASSGPSATGGTPATPMTLSPALPTLALNTETPSDAESMEATREIGATLAVVAAMPSIPPSVAIDSATMRAAVASWVPMVARTWVNVRNDASRDGNVVGVINPASRAMLGETRGGWRQVRSTDVTGWVDPTLFDADTLRHRG